MHSHSRKRLPAISVAACAAGLALLFALPAAANTYYVSPSGSGSNPGTDRDAPTSLAQANAVVFAGDVCVLLPGNYSTRIQPARSGTMFNRITYVGDIHSPNAATVTSIEINQEWISVKGVAANGGVTLEYPARRDSIAWCALGGVGFQGAKNCIVARNQVNGHVAFLLDRGLALGPAISNCDNDTLRGNRIDTGPVIAWHNFKIRGYTQNCLIDSNVVTAVFDASSPGDGVARIFYNSSHNVVRDNSWRFTSTVACPNGGEPWYGFVMRDSAMNYTFERDTVLLGVDSPYGIRGIMCHGGSFPNSVSGNVYDHCVYKTNSYIYVQAPFTRSVIQYSVFASPGDKALWFMNAMDGSQLRHNLFYSAHQSVRFEVPFTGSGNEITSNIFYSTDATPPSGTGCQVFVAGSAMTNVTSDNNLWFTPSYTSFPGDRALYLACCVVGSAVGAGSSWYRNSGQDGASRYGSPRLADSTFANLNPRLSPGSRAVGVGRGGTDAGPYPLGARAGDGKPPAAIVDLRFIEAKPN